MRPYLLLKVIREPKVVRAGLCRSERPLQVVMAVAVSFREPVMVILAVALDGSEERVIADVFFVLILSLLILFFSLTMTAATSL